MNLKRINWSIWIGLLLSLFAFISYFLIFISYPATRDFPWANLILFAAALGLLAVGVRRAFVKDGLRRSKVVASIVATFGVLVFVFFIFNFFVAGRWLPSSQGAPRVGQKAPEFTLPDTSNKQVALAELLSSPVNGRSPKGVLLIFYRGYW
jgi:hypothetical protein